MPRVRIEFRKGEAVRFLSHLDLMATLEYAIRRAHLPVELSEGFNPRPRLSLAAPLPLGYLGEHEILELALRSALPPEQIQERLQTALPPGIDVLGVQELPAGRKAAASRLHSATYRMQVLEPIQDAQARIADLLSRPNLYVEEQRDGGVRRRDLRPLILSLEVSGSEVLRTRVQLGTDGTVRPEQILQLLSIPTDGAQITRERIDLKD